MNVAKKKKKNVEKPMKKEHANDCGQCKKDGYVKDANDLRQEKTRVSTYV